MAPSFSTTSRPSKTADKQPTPLQHESENTEDQPTAPAHQTLAACTGQANTLVRNVVSPICRRWLPSLSGPLAVPSLAAPWRAHSKGSKGSGQDQTGTMVPGDPRRPKSTAPHPPPQQFEALAEWLADGGRQTASPPALDSDQRQRRQASAPISTTRRKNHRAGRYREPTAQPVGSVQPWQ